MPTTTHRIWKYGDNVNTDVIFPGKYTYTVSHDPKLLAQHALEDLDPDFAANVAPGDVIVAGRNWGNGSSREQAVTCLAHAGIRAVIASSFARIYYRNAINNGLLVITCKDIVALARTGDLLQMNLENGELIWEERRFTFPRLPAEMRRILDAGGIIPYLKSQPT